MVQAARQPTALPLLSQPSVGQAKGEVEPLSAAGPPRRDRRETCANCCRSARRGARESEYLADSEFLGELASKEDGEDFG
ncbi:hypothetical protein [Streptomyces sp. HC307]|uniref:hypothetical protein n=1 Tax=Streptomyces flavusporus TaxID=3385496 RepID=UPI003916DBAE